MIETESADGVCTIRLCRPEQRNALTPEMLREIRSHALRTQDTSMRCVLIEGAGRVFSAGFDLRLAAADPTGDTMRALLRELSETIQALRNLDLPVVIAAQGAAIAGACALLAGADIVVSNAEAKLGYPVLLLGISPAVSAPFLQRDIAPGIARERMLDTRLISGARAFESGLVHHLVENPECVRVEAERIALSIARKPISGVRATKRWLRLLTGVSEDLRNEGLSVSLGLVGSDEERERLGKAWGNRSS